MLVFDKYQVIRRLAVGGMGEIFLARQTGVAGFDRLVILKSLLPELAEQPGFINQFLDEARVAATLNHPNIVSIYEVGEWRSIYFIAMEYIRGENLGRLLQAVTTAELSMPLVIPMRVVHDAALALDHAHHAADTTGKPLAIVHRDIGLQNVMVRSDGVTKVVDFGIARAANRSTRTRTGLVKGKLQYMSPEQIHGKELDGRSDQFSLGVVLWEMATQSRLFKADHDLATIQKITSEPVPSPSTVAPGIPAALEAVIMRMLARDRDERYDRCVDAATALKSVIEQEGDPDPQKTIGAFVERVLGEKLAEMTSDLTPSAETPFSPALGLSGLQSLGTDQTVAVETTAEHARRVVRRRISAGLLATAVLALGGGVAAWGLGWIELPSLVPGPKLEVIGPEGARVVVDGEIWRHSAPTVVTGLREGLHRVSLELPEMPAIKKRITLGRDERVVINEKPPPKAMVLDIREPVGALVIVDGKKWDNPVPTIVTGLSDGPHEVRLQLKDGTVLKKRVALEVGAPILIQEPPPETGMVLDIRDPEGATVIIDGAPWHEPVPTVVTGLAVGEHEVELQLPNRPTLKKRFLLEVGKPVLVQEPPPPMGVMAIDIREPIGAHITIDGKRHKKIVPTVITGLTPGEHTVRLEAAGRQPMIQKITLKKGVAVLLQELPPPAPPVLLVRSKPSGAWVRVGPRKLGRTPARIETLKANQEHTLVFERRGYEPQTMTLTLAPGDKREINVPLVRAGRGPGHTPPRDAPKANGFLTLRTTPWVKVSIDHKPFGSTPLYKVELSPGPHTLQLVNEEFSINTTRKVTISSGKTKKMNLPLK